MLREKFLSTILSYDLVSPGESILLGVSGGVDSVVMLDLFCSLKEQWELSLFVGHYNHKQRDSADRDERFVIELCKNLGIPYVIEHLKKPLDSGIGKEFAMRKLRYEFFLKEAVKLKVDKVALAHNLDDQAETVLMNFLRGSGLQGLRGMPIKRVLKDNIRLIRPLLTISRLEIEDYAKEKNLKYCVDESNFSYDFLRNRIRLELLPLLEKGYNKKIKDRLFSLSEIVEKDFDFIYSQAKLLFKDLVLMVNEREVLLSRGKLLNLHQSLLRQIFRLAIEVLVGDTNGIEFRHCLEFLDMTKNWPEGGILDIPRGISIEKRKKTIRFYLRENLQKKGEK